MADKKITELTLRDEITDDLNLPSDDGIQSYRVTGAQFKDYILADQAVLLAMLKNDIFNGLSAVTPAADDYFILNDTSDSNKMKKGLVSSFQTPVVSSKTSADDTTAVLYTDDLVLVNTGTAFGMTMFGSASGGKPIRLQKISMDFNAFTLTRAGSDQFREMGVLSNTLTLKIPGEEVMIVKTATNVFEVIRRNPNGAAGLKMGWNFTTGVAMTPSANHLHVVPFTCPRTFVATKMSIFMSDTGSAGNKINLAIYDSSSGLPVNRLAVCNEKTRTTTDVGIFLLNLQTPVQLVEGTEYFLAVHSDANLTLEAAFQNVNSGKQKYYNTTYLSNSMPATLGAPTANSGGCPAIGVY